MTRLQERLGENNRATPSVFPAAGGALSSDEANKVKSF